MRDEEIDMDENEDQVDEGAYELDLETAEDAEEAMRSALDAVEKKKRKRRIISIDGPEQGAAAREDEPAPAHRGEADRLAEEVASGDGAATSQEAKVLKERLLRTLADFDNFRKRTEREKATLKRFAVSEVLKDLLGVVDNLERASSASGTIEELKQGLEMILRQQAEVMKRFGVEPIDTVDQPFDPTLHEAVAREDSADVAVPTVLRELQKGYTIHDRLLRPAMVHVAMPTAASRGGSRTAADGDRDETRGSE